MKTVKECPVCQKKFSSRDTEHCSVSCATKNRAGSTGKGETKEVYCIHCNKPCAASKFANAQQARCKTCIEVVGVASRKECLEGMGNARLKNFQRNMIKHAEGPFTPIMLRKCKLTGKTWWSSSTKSTVHPDVKNGPRFRDSCRFNFNPYMYPEWFEDGLQLLAEFDWYRTQGSKGNKSANPNGVSRDHMISVSDGFKHGIDPDLLRHPANCALILQRENSRKKSTSTITLDQLKERIALFERMYPDFQLPRL